MKTKRLLSMAIALAIISVSQIGSVSALQASPRKSAEMTLNGKKISLDYGAPSVRGRKIFGELVPYNTVWRLGANEATQLKTEADLMFGNVAVPKGSYTLWVWPAETGWKLIINKTTGVWGRPYKPEYEKTELARIEMKTGKTKAPVEQMALSLSQAGSGGEIRMEWDNTSASVNFTEKK